MNNTIQKPETILEKSGGATQEIETPSGLKVELKTFFTPRERNKLKRATLGGMTITADPSNPKQAQTSDINGDVSVDIEESVLEVGVVKIIVPAKEDEKEPTVMEDKQQIKDFLLDGNPADYDLIVEHLEPLLSSLFQKAK